MVAPVSVIEGPYLRDILDQPRAVAETHRRLEPTAELERVARALADGRYRRIVLTGMGSSYFALHPLHLRLVEDGRPSFMVETSELLHYQRRLLEEDTLLVLVSQSGRSAEIVRLLAEARGRLHTIGVTNTARSPLGRDATAVVLTHAGEEATVSCKTYVASQVALAWLGSVLTGQDETATREALLSTVEAAGTYLAGWRGHVAELGALLAGVRAVYYAGRGPSLAAALCAGLITKESTYRPAEGMSGAAFRHGPMEILSDEIMLLAFAGEARTRELNAALVRDARAAGGRAHLVSEDAEHAVFRLPTLPPVARPVMELLPVEMVTLALAALDGREAGRFRIAGKVTTTE